MSIIVIQQKKIDGEWFEKRVSFSTFLDFENFLDENKGKFFKVVCYDSKSV